MQSSTVPDAAVSDAAVSGPAVSGPTVLGKVFHSFGGFVAGTILALIVLMAIIAPLIAPYSATLQSLINANRPPSIAHWFGTDEFGRDVLTRVMYGARVSLGVGLSSIALSAVSGIFLGSLCGYFGGRFDRTVMSVVDLTWCFPEILLALLLVAIIGPGISSTIVAIAIAYLAQFTRLTRTQIKAVKQETFVEVSENLGASHLHIILRRLLPNSLAPVVVVSMLATGDAILLEATLGFFGMGAQPPTPSWGEMMSAGSSLLFTAPWEIVIPGAFIALTVLSINIFGDAVLRALDIKNRVRES